MGSLRVVGDGRKWTVQGKKALVYRTEGANITTRVRHGSSTTVFPDMGIKRYVRLGLQVERIEDRSTQRRILGLFGSAHL